VFQFYEFWTDALAVWDGILAVDAVYKLKTPALQDLLNPFRFHMFVVSIVATLAHLMSCFRSASVAIRSHPVSRSPPPISPLMKWLGIATVRNQVEPAERAMSLWSCCHSPLPPFFTFATLLLYGFR
jgi:hypothetical protein